MHSSTRASTRAHKQASMHAHAHMHCHLTPAARRPPPAAHRPLSPPQPPPQRKKDRMLRRLCLPVARNNHSGAAVGRSGGRAAKNPLPICQLDLHGKKLLSGIGKFRFGGPTPVGGSDCATGECGLLGRFSAKFDGSWFSANSTALGFQQNSTALSFPIEPSNTDSNDFQQDVESWGGGVGGHSKRHKEGINVLLGSADPFEHLNELLLPVKTFVRACMCTSMQVHEPTQTCTLAQWQR